MRFPDSHVLLCFFVYPGIAFVFYSLLMYFLCQFIAVGEDADSIRRREHMRARRLPESRR